MGTPQLRDNIFTPSRGSRKKASKVIVVLTDGETFEDPLNLTDVINSPQMQGIERFAIGVRAMAWGRGQRNSCKQCLQTLPGPPAAHAYIPRWSQLAG